MATTILIIFIVAQVAILTIRISLFKIKGKKQQLEDDNQQIEFIYNWKTRKSQRGGGHSADRGEYL